MAIKLFKHTQPLPAAAAADSTDDDNASRDATRDATVSSLMDTAERNRAQHMRDEVQRNARCEVEALSAVARFRCEHLPTLVDVVYQRTVSSTLDDDSDIDNRLLGATKRPRLLEEAERRLLASDKNVDNTDGSVGNNDGGGNDDENASSDSDIEDEVDDGGDDDALAARPIQALILPLFSGGDLATFCDASRGVSESLAKRIMRQLVSAVATLHSAGFVHRDIKADNVLVQSVDDDGCPHVILCDFGLSVREGAGPLRPSGTLEYIAPEATLQNYTATASIDCWALGVLLFALVAHRFPFANVQAIRSCRYAPSRRFSSQLTAFLARILVEAPAQRLTVDQFFNDPWWNDDYPLELRTAE